MRRKIDEMLPHRIHLLSIFRRLANRRSLGSLSAIVLLWTLNAGTTAYAQDDTDDLQVEPINLRFQVSENEFDSWVFQNLQNASVARTQLEKVLKLHTDDVDRACKLAANQRKKLQLAGQGDIKRFFEQVELVRQKFLLARADENKFNEIWQEIQPLQTKIQSGLYGDESLFQKTLRNMLGGEQLEHYSRYDGERRLFHYRARVELVVSMLENVLPLRDEQRQKLIALAIDQTQPPRQFGEQDYYVVLWNLSKLPESKLKPLFNQSEWKVLTQQFAQVQALEDFLKQNGSLENEANGNEEVREVRR